MKKLFLATTFILALSITTLFAQDRKEANSATKKVENTTQEKAKLNTAKEKEATKKAESNCCPESAKKGAGCCDKKTVSKDKNGAKLQEKPATEKQVAPPMIKQRPSNHPALQQTFPGGEHDKRVSANVKAEKKEALDAKKVEKRRTNSKELNKAPERRNSRVTKATKEKKETIQPITPIKK